MTAPAQHLISAILRTGDLQTALDKGITADVVGGFVPEWDYITDYVAKYGKVPPKAKFKDKHRDFTIKAVDDVAASADDALYVYRRKEYAKLANEILQGVEHDDLGEAQKAIDRAMSNGLYSLDSQVLIPSAWAQPEPQLDEAAMYGSLAASSRLSSHTLKQIAQGAPAGAPDWLRQRRGAWPSHVCRGRQAHAKVVRRPGREDLSSSQGHLLVEYQGGAGAHRLGVAGRIRGQWPVQW
jgi:hypothetical protein